MRLFRKPECYRCGRSPVRWELSYLGAAGPAKYYFCSSSCLRAFVCTGGGMPRATEKFYRGAGADG